MCLPPVWPTLVLLTAFGVRVPEAFSSHAVLSVSVRAGHVRFRRLRVACFRGAATCPVASLGAPGCETGGGIVLSIGRRPGGTRNGFKLARPGGAHSVLVACGSPRSFPERHVGPWPHQGDSATQRDTRARPPARGAALRRAQCQTRTPPSGRAPPGGLSGGGVPGSGSRWRFRTRAWEAAD